MKILLLFLDGVGWGTSDPNTNPFDRANLPCLTGLLGGHKLHAGTPLPLVTDRATLIVLDACLGVDGDPQSATGQAALLTGMNLPHKLGCHFGPKPNREIAAILENGNLFSLLHKAGLNTALLNSYPPRYFRSIETGHRLPGTIAMAALKAGLQLMTEVDLYAGKALSADFTGQGWRDHLGYADAPLLIPCQAGKQLAIISSSYHFSIFDYWLSDIAGHRQDMGQACQMLELFDQVLGGLLAAWDDNSGLILIVSDHGNLEELSTRRHTRNPVPFLIIGAPGLRQKFLEKIQSGKAGDPDITMVAPAILTYYGLHASILQTPKNHPCQP